MKDILDPSSVGFRPHQVLLLSISYATSTVLVVIAILYSSSQDLALWQMGQSAPNYFMKSTELAMY